MEVNLPEADIGRERRYDQIIKAKERFGESLEQIKPVAQTVLSKLGSLTVERVLLWKTLIWKKQCVGSSLL